MGERGASAPVDCEKQGVDAPARQKVNGCTTMFLTNPCVHRRLVLLGTTLLGMAAGCASNAGAPKLVPVTGKLTVGGTPLPGAVISFWPDGQTTQDIPHGKTDDQGHYALTTRNKKGAPAARYKVTVAIPRELTRPQDRFDPPSKPTWHIDAKYAKAKTTNLSAEVKEGQEPLSFDFDLSP